MKITYIDDLHVPAVGEWKGDAVGDPLHPAFGPLPDLVGHLACQGEEFIVCLWDTPQAILVMLEMLKDDDPDPDAPLIPIDEAYKMRGFILQTYRWSVTDEGLLCQGRLVMPPEHGGSDVLWERTMYRMIMKESLRIAATTPVGLG